MMRHTKYIAFLFFIVNYVHASDADGNIEYYCNARTSSFVIGEIPKNINGYIKHIVNYSDLIVYEKLQKNGYVQYRTGSKTLRKRCGVIDIKIYGGFVNSNIQGQDGAIEFPVIEIIRNNRTILEKTNMEECVVTDNRMNNNCPGKWGYSIKTMLTPEKSIAISIAHKFFDKNDNEQTTIETIKR